MKIGVKIFIILLVILLVVVILSFRWISFGEIRGIVVDENNQPLENAKVLVGYGCSTFSIAHPITVYLGHNRTVTNDKGEFIFEKINFGLKNRIFYFNCGKSVSTYKVEYCGFLKTFCDHDYFDPISTGISTPKHDPNGDFYYYDVIETGVPTSYFIYYDYSYFHANYYSVTHSIPETEKYTVLQLEKIKKEYNIVPESCGDGICDEDENKYNCLNDCKNEKCTDDSYCKTNKAPICNRNTGNCYFCRKCGNDCLQLNEGIALECNLETTEKFVCDSIDNGCNKRLVG